MIRIDNELKYQISYFQSRQNEFLDFMGGLGVEGAILPYQKFNEIIAAIAVNELGIDKIAGINPIKYGDDGFTVDDNVCEIKNIMESRTSIDFNKPSEDTVQNYKKTHLLIIICKMIKSYPVEIIYGYSDEGIGQFIEDTIKRQVEQKVIRARTVTVTLYQCLNNFGFKSMKMPNKVLDKIFEAA